MLALTGRTLLFARVPSKWGQSATGRGTALGRSFCVRRAAPDYDKVIKQLEESGQGHPSGRQFHAAARKGNGYLVTDVWESQEALDRFFQILGPLLEQVGPD